MPKEASKQAAKSKLNKAAVVVDEDRWYRGVNVQRKVLHENDHIHDDLLLIDRLWNFVPLTFNFFSPYTTKGD